MKKIILILLFSVVGVFAQPTQTKYLSSGGDSIWTYMSLGEWVEIIAIDSADGDTVNVYIPNGYGGYCPIGNIKHLEGFSDVTEITPTVGVDGDVYHLWMAYPRAITFMLESTGGAAEMWLKVTYKP